MRDSPFLVISLNSLFETMYDDMFEEEMGKKGIFKDQSKLSPDYVPEELVHRDDEFRELVRLFKPVLENKASQRVLISGSVGVGKTALASRFGKEFENEANKRDIDLKYAHVNCRKSGTSQMVLNDLASNFPLSVPRRGFAPQEIMGHIIDYLEKQDVFLLVTLDEIDYFIRQNGPDLLYSLSRAAEESDAKNRVSIIATAFSPDFLEEVDEATRSTFMHNQIRMDKYSSEQLYDILDQRVDKAFRKDTVKFDTVDLISDIASRRGDARFALELLWYSGRIADKTGQGEVLPNHVRKAKSEINPEIRKDVLKDLSNHELLTLLALSRRLMNSDEAYVLTGDLEESYNIVCEEYEEEARKHVQFLSYIDKLENLGIVDKEKSRGGHRGQSQRISISDAPPELMEKEIEKILNG